MAIATLLTAHDFYTLPDSHPDCELWRGVLRPVTRTSGGHGLVIFRLAAVLGPFVISRGLGACFSAGTGVVIERDPDTVLCPDTMFVARERLPKEGFGWWFLEMVPDLAVEVLSPSERAGAVRDKVALYLQRGVRTVWVIDPRRRTVRIHVPGKGETLLGEGDELAGGEVVPGFRCPVAWLFADLRR
jgi:Uma2 family endonuclease